MQSIGRNDTISVPGLCTPTTATMSPSVAAMLYAGAVDETAMTTLEIMPSAPWRRPLLPGALGSAMTFAAIGHHLPPVPPWPGMLVLYLNTIFMYRFLIRNCFSGKWAWHEQLAAGWPYQLPPGRHGGQPRAGGHGGRARRQGRQPRRPARWPAGQDDDAAGRGHSTVSRALRSAAVPAPAP